MRPRSRWLRDAGRSRPLINVLLVALSTVAVLAAVLGPLLVRAVGQSTLQDAVASAGLHASAITVTTELGAETPARVTDAVTQALAPVRRGASASLWAAPRLWTESTDNLAWGPAKGSTVAEGSSRVRVADGGCPGLTVASGRCPTTTGQVMVAADDASAHGVSTGSRVLLRAGDGYTTAEATVVGTYTPDPSDPTAPRPGTPAGTEATVTAGPLVLTVNQSTELGLSVNVVGRVALAGGLRLQDEPSVRDAVVAVRTAVLEQARTILVDDSLPKLLDRVDDQVRSATVLVLVSEVQALGLAVFAVAVVLQRTARARTAEWGIGRLRGVPRRRWFASIYVEPAVALLLGLPIGVALGWAIARWSVTAHLRAGTPVELTRWPVVAAAGAVTLAVLVALVVVSVPSLRRPLVELIGQRSESRRSTVVGAVAQSAVVLLALASVYELVQGGVLRGGGSQLGLLAPGLLALALAVVAIRVAVLVVRRVTSRPPRRLGALVVGRQAARTPSTLNPAVVIAVGVAIAVFATQVLLISQRNQDLRADAVTGAATVLTVEGANPAGLVAAVDAADPSGRAAMAVQERAGIADVGVERVVAVDSARFAAVTAWSTAWADVDVATALRPSAVPPVTLTGTRVEVGVSGYVVNGSGEPPSASPRLLATVDTGTRWQTVDLGALAQSGRPDTTLRAAIPCRAGCRLVSLATLSPQRNEFESGPPYDISFTVTGIGTVTQPVATSYPWLRTPDRWRSRVGDQVTAEPRARAVPEATPAGLTVHAVDRDGSLLTAVLPADTQDPLPAVVTAQSGAEPFAGIPDATIGRGLDGLPQLLTVAGHASVLPRSLTDGVLVDLTAAQRLVDPSTYHPTSEVWLAADAPPGIESRLTDAGLRITGRELRSTTQAALDQQPSTRAAAASVSLGYAALVLALLALVAARVADVSRRRPDWRSLRDAGLTGRVVRRLAFGEIAVPAVLGAVLGTLSGVVASQLAAPRLPLVDQSIPGPPLDLGVGWVWVAGIGVAVVVVTVLTGAVAARWETRTSPEGRA